MDRREFLSVLAAFTLSQQDAGADSAVPVQYRRASPFESAFARIDPSAGKFERERHAAFIEGELGKLLAQRALPLAPHFQGISPLPSRYEAVADRVSQAVFNGGTNFESGLVKWIESLGAVRRSAFSVLPDDVVRYEIASEGAYRVGTWKQRWQDGQLVYFAPIAETLVSASESLFQDVTARAFERAESFQRQLLNGSTWWRARLDASAGIDVYGNNGIAAGDIDNDGWDEIYVCQPGGLPNRLYKNRGDATFEDITEHAGVGILDDTTCALFLDLRNTGHQDLVVLRASGPLLFLNTGAGTFRPLPDAFHFAKQPLGSFTGMAAADYDGDGQVDLYLCCYVYFQSEDQYRYPAPYHDARNGPPNFLFHNRLTSEGGFFQDVTHESGLDENNDRYSFAPAWCDFDGDGWPDLYVANDFGRNNLYRNRGGKFRDEAASAGVENIGPAMSAAWFDYDGDGHPDLYVSNMWTAPGQRLVRDSAFKPALASPDEYRRHAKGNSLFRNRGEGEFDETTLAENVAMGRWAWSADARDFDNDGVPEIYIACGMLTNGKPGAVRKPDLNSFFWREVVANSPPSAVAAPAYENGWNAINQLIREDYSWCGHEPNVFYMRPKPRPGHPPRYYDFSGISGIDFADDSRAFAVLDFDGDGNLDMVLKSRLGPQVRALRNQCGVGRPVIVVRLRGTRSNRDAIGARVEVNGHAQFVSAGSGYLSQHTKHLHFALGNSPLAQMKIRWPSGLIQNFEGLPPGFKYEVEEGSDKVQRTPLLPRRTFDSAGPALQPLNEPEPTETWLLEPVPLPDRRKGPGFVLLYSGEKPSLAELLPIETIDVLHAPDEVAATYAIFRRYLFDYRAGLELPMLLLIDDRGRAHKIYFAIPPAERLRADLRMLNEANRDHLALPFRGQYFTRPQRNYFKHGAALYWAGYPDQAIPYLAETLRRDPGNWRCNNAIAQIHLEAGRYRQSLSSYRMSLEIKPANTAALYGAGQAHAKVGELPAAEKMFQTILDANVNDADAANQLGLVYARQGRQQDAKRLFEQAIAARKDHTSAIDNLGALFVDLGQFNEALAVFKYGVEIAPGDSQLLMNLVRVYLTMGEKERARGALQKFLDAKPGDAVATKALRELESR